MSKQQQRKIRAHYKLILFPSDWPHTQDGEITEKRIGELEWEYAVASKNICDTLRDIDEGDDSDDGDNTEVTGTTEATQACIVSRGTLQRDHQSTPITDWARSDEAPPGWRTKTLPLTPDSTIKAIHEALEKVAQKIDPTSHVHRPTVSRSRHILASIISKHARSTNQHVFRNGMRILQPMIIRYPRIGGETKLDCAYSTSNER